MPNNSNGFNESISQSISLIQRNAETQKENPRNLASFYNNIALSQQLFQKSDNDDESTLLCLYNALLVKILYNIVEEDYVQGSVLSKLSSEIGESMSTLSKQSCTKPFRDIVVSYKEALRSKIEVQRKKLNTEIHGPLYINIATNHGDIQVSSTSFPYMVDMDYNLCDCDIRKYILDEFLNQIQAISNNIDIFCFIEKIKGPVGALGLHGLLAKTFPDISTIIYRPRHDDFKSKFHGVTPQPKQNILIVYDLAVSGQGLIEAAKAIEERYQKVKVTDAVVLCDYALESSKVRKEVDNEIYLTDGKEVNIHLHPIITYSPSDFQKDFSREYKKDLKTLLANKKNLDNNMFKEKMKELLNEYYALTMLSEE